MRGEIGYPFQPDYAIPPGETLQETLGGVGMTQAQLAERTGLTTKTINLIVKGKAPVTPETALQLERVLGTPASFWNNRERQYRETLARLQEEKQLEEHTAWLKDMPYRPMVGLGWIPDAKEPVARIQILLNYFGVASPQQWKSVWEKPVAAFRDSKAFQKDPGAVSAWLRKGEIEAQKIHTKPYEEGRFREALGRARSLTQQPPETFEPALRKLCSDSGVAWVLIPELPGTHAHGATRWLTPEKALIQLSLRYKSNDQLWFSFFHEAGHILLHGKREVFLEDHSVPSNKEVEADRFASDKLIPPSDYMRLVSQGPPYTKLLICRFAKQVGIAPGIIVGRLQHDGKLPPSHCNDLKVRLAWAN